MRTILGRQFTDESPRNFGGLAVVVMDVKTGLAPILNLQMVELGLG